MTRWQWAALFLSAAGLRLAGLNGALWYDEAFSAWLAQLPLDRLIEATLGDVHPPGYYLLLWAWGHITSFSEVDLRLPSLAAGLALIYVVYRLALALGFETKTASAAAIMAAFSPFQIYYSQEARSYEVLTLLVAAAALALLNNRLWLAAIAGAATLFLHDLAGVFLAALWLGALASGRVNFKQLVKSGLFLTVLGLPSLYFTLHQLGSVGADYWIPPLNSPGRLLATLDDLVWFAPNSPFVFATGLLTAVGLIILVYDLFEPRRREGRKVFLFLAVLSLLPLMVISLVSVLWRPVLISRVLAPSAPFLLIWLAAAVTASAWRLRAALLVGLPTAALIIAAMVAGPAGRAPVDQALLRQMGQADAVYHANLGSYIVWHYYLPNMPQYVWPQDTSLGQALSFDTRRAMGVDEADFEFVACQPLYNNGQVNQRRDWLLIYFNNPVTFQSEMDYVDHLLADYPAERVKLLRKDSTAEGWLVRLAPCMNVPL